MLWTRTYKKTGLINTKTFQVSIKYYLVRIIVVNPVNISSKIWMRRNNEPRSISFFIESEKVAYWETKYGNLNLEFSYLYYFDPNKMRKFDFSLKPLLG